MRIPRTLRLALTLLALGALPGCALMRQCFGPRDPFAASAPCVLRPDATAAEVVAHLNANTSRIRGWRSDRVKISGRGAAKTPVRLDATLAVESPRNFRLTAASPMGEEIDLGSNLDQFWVWNRRSPQKYVFVAYHDAESLDQRQPPIPFQPDWILEALGVTPIDPAAVTAQPGPEGSRLIYLTAERRSPQGRPVRQVTVVDACHGVVREQALFDDTGRRIARAVLSGPVIDQKSRAVLPSRIDLEWPQADLGLTLEIREIHVLENGPQGRNLPSHLWQVPRKEGYQVFDMTGAPVDAGETALPEEL